MKKLKVTLKQHTPLIHFQYDQPGATLRASEFKPRFDKYLTQTIERGNYDYWKSFLVGSVVDANMDETAGTATQNNLNARDAKLMNKFNNGSFCALDYKLKIVTSGSASQEMERLPMYFANQGNVEYKYDVYTQKEVILKFSSFHDGLLKLIEDNISVFLSKTNFGTRQTKGYGAFYLNGKEPEGANYYFNIDTSDLNILFKTISEFYAVIRSGINNNGLYVKSALFKYLKEDNRQWDKRTIKGFFYSESEINAEQTKHPEADSPLVEVDAGSKIMYKELLGLSTSEVWSDKNATGIEATLTRKNKDIQRFKSPVLFKPISVEEDGRKYFKVFIFLTPIPEEARKDETEKNGHRVFEIKWTPRAGTVKTESMYMDPDYFDIEKYFAWIHSNKTRLISMLTPQYSNLMSTLQGMKIMANRDPHFHINPNSKEARCETLDNLFRNLTRG